MNWTDLTKPVGVVMNPREKSTHVQHLQIPHTEKPVLACWVGARVMNPPEGEAMYTCLTSGTGFFANMMPTSTYIQFASSLLHLKHDDSNTHDCSRIGQQ